MTYRPINASASVINERNLADNGGLTLKINHVSIYVDNVHRMVILNEKGPYKFVPSLNLLTLIASDPYASMVVCSALNLMLTFLSICMTLSVLFF